MAIICSHIHRVHKEEINIITHLKVTKLFVIQNNSGFLVFRSETIKLIPDIQLQEVELKKKFYTKMACLKTKKKKNVFK